MTTHAMGGTEGGKGGGEQALRWIGDLDHPFYSDERNRYVWYEASAIAFQLLFIGSYFSTGAVLWVAGGASLPYALALFVPVLVAGGVFQGYLRANSAEYWPGRNDLRRRRGLLVVFAGVFLLSGLIRAVIDLQANGPDDGFSGGFGGGMTIGLLIGPAAAVAALVYHRMQQNKAEQRDEF